MNHPFRPTPPTSLVRPLRRGVLVAVGFTAVAAAACGTVRVAVDHWYELTLDSSASAASAGPGTALTWSRPGASV